MDFFDVFRFKVDIILIRWDEYLLTQGAKFDLWVVVFGTFSLRTLSSHLYH